MSLVTVCHLEQSLEDGSLHSNNVSVGGGGHLKIYIVLLKAQINVIYKPAV